MLGGGAAGNLAGLPVDLEGLLTHDAAAWRDKLKDSGQQNFISAAALGQAEELITLLRALRVGQAEQPVAPGRASLASVLALAPALASAETRQVFLTLYEHHEGTIEEFWTKAVPEQMVLDPV